MSETDPEVHRHLLSLPYDLVSKGKKECVGDQARGSSIISVIGVRGL